jgi:hypothetical protein
MKEIEDPSASIISKVDDIINNTDDIIGGLSRLRSGIIRQLKSLTIDADKKIALYKTKLAKNAYQVEIDKAYLDECLINVLRDDKL